MASKHSGRLKIPKRVGVDGTKASDLHQFVDRVTDFESSKRHELSIAVQKANLALMNIGWVKVERPDLGTSSSGVRRTPRVIADRRTDIPQPCRPLALKLHENEVARTSKRFSEITIEARDAADPSSRAAAKVATNVLKDHLHGDNGINWTYQHRQFWDQDYRHGLTVLKSYQLRDYQDTTPYPVLTAVKCNGSRGVETKRRSAERPIADPVTGEPIVDPMTGQPAMEQYEEEYQEPFEKPSCGSWLSDRKVPADKVESLGGGAITAFEVDGFSGTPDKPVPSYSAVACPCCQGDLKPETPTFQEAAGTKDYFGRPLGKPQPKWKQMVAVRHILGYFPENEGIGLEPHEVKSHGEIYVVPMSWVEQYFPSAAKQITLPTSPEEIAEIFPVGEYDPVSKGSRGVNDRNLWANHLLIKEFNTEERTEEHPKGRSIIVACAASGPVVLMDEDFWMPGVSEEDDEIGRVEFGLARCFMRDGEVWGDGFPTMSASAVKSIDMTTSQLIDKREHSLFGIIATKGMDLIRELKNTLAGMIWRWRPDPLAPGMKPEVIQTQLSDTSGLNEIKYHEEAIHGDLGVNDADIGGLKDLASTPYSMYALAKESTGERREPRLKEGLEAIRRVLKHQLVLMHRFNREPREYRVKAADGWEVKEYLGADLAGETDVKIKEEPFFDEKAAQRDATAKAVELGQLQLPTKRAQREYFKAIGVKTEILDESNVQLDRAEQNWMAWLREKRIPIINPTRDDLDLHHQELGRFLFADDGVECAQKAGWDEVLDAIPGWEEEVNTLQAALPGIKALGWVSGQPIIRQEQPTDPLTGEPIPGEPVTVNLLDQAAQQTYQQQAEQAAMLDQQAAEAAFAQGAVAPPPTQVPPPTPSQFKNQEPLKAGKQWLVLWVWNDMCARVGVDTKEPERASFMAINAVCEAYRLLSMDKTGVMPIEPGADAAAAGQPVQQVEILRGNVMLADLDKAKKRG